MCHILNSFLTPFATALVEESSPLVNSGPILHFYAPGSNLCVHFDSAGLFFFFVAYATVCSSLQSQLESTRTLCLCVWRRMDPIRPIPRRLSALSPPTWPFTSTPSQIFRRFLKFVILAREARLAPGDALFFTGSRTPHYRNRLEEGRSVISLSFSWDIRRFFL